ncbi:nucleotidyltransferase domain-containing protein [Abyssisolibacter fermentans]|uniref:nucleotidyltransferase domain-containing protein n=1 Tax=Abyssisolibacter fermentans TaxID=1766203 RepID=UPI0012E3B089|nr:nucleotidyltransferase domain-containing protein [Abyssisolibacter fermentans]
MINGNNRLIRRINDKMILNKVLENIQQLQCELQKISSSIQNEIVSVIIDGSIIRGDFIEDSSDIDITITTVHKNVDLQTKRHIEDVVKNIQSKLPKREQQRKPLFYDVQWQDIKTVKDCGHRLLNEWSIDNIPKGYPKLWLYAFDSIKYHEVIYGQDIICLYTKIEPQYFIPIRMKRIQKSVIDLGDRISDYDVNNGTITQIKNAWETIRCICIEKGLLSIRKNDVIQFCKEHFSDMGDLEIIEDLYYFYLNEKNTKLLEGNYRKKLYDFTLNMIQRYYIKQEYGYRE